MTELDGRDGPATFARRYTKTWVHAVATAALTAFGTLTVVDQRFAAVAIAAYVLPPVVLYLGVDGDGDAAAASSSETGPGSSAASATDSATWTLASVPTDARLYDAASTEAGAYAVGADGTLVADDGTGWETVLSDGPRAQSQTLRGVDSVGDGGGVWIAGDGGTVARVDPETGRHVDHSEPAGDTSNLVAVAASSGPDGERVLLGDGSGRVRRGDYRDGSVAWRDPVTPGSGSSLAGLAFGADATGWVCDTSQGVFETADAGRSFTDAGIGGVTGTLTDVAATSAGPVVGTDAGVVYRRDSGSWTPERVADAALRSVAGRGDRWLACGDDGAVFERAAAADWERAVTPTTESLNGVAVGGSRALAVGDGGTVLECDGQ
ncbi:WD40/YVTN/BNR-like repeat-containing protein [Haloarcula salina]|uniref:WD40/YVTN/BNR-like repeat-containing protein n=1 Tax=Haloarcula salina TaxID=1429914 RepID=UPI003C6F3DFF